MSKSIKFPAEHYLGMITREQSEGTDFLPLGFMTVEGTDAAAVKRKSTVDNWVSQNSTGWNHTTRQQVQRNQPKPVVLKNEPMAGFRLLDEIKRYSGWGSGNVKWRVEDPRGFELEITSPNLMQILACSVVDKGEILDMCMWAREGGDNVLVPVSSEVYTTAMENTKRVAKSASLRDLEMGDTVLLQNGTTGRYYGKMWAIEHDYSDSDGYSSRYGGQAGANLKLKLMARHVFINDEAKTMHAISSPKLSEITKGEPITPQVAEKFVAKVYKSRDWTNHVPGYTTHGFTFSKTKPVVTREKHEHKLDQHRYGTRVFEVNGVYYQLYSGGYGDKITGERIDTDAWVNHSLVRHVGTRDHYFSHYRSGANTFSVDDLHNRGVKFYRPVTRITTEAGIVYTVEH
jgi:hypothetical protein